MRKYIPTHNGVTDDSGNSKVFMVDYNGRNIGYIVNLYHFWHQPIYSPPKVHGHFKPMISPIIKKDNFDIHITYRSEEDNKIAVMKLLNIDVFGESVVGDWYSFNAEKIIPWEIINE